MSKGLEALETIKTLYGINGIVVSSDMELAQEKCKEIEQELKEGEKNKKALEIIKEKIKFEEIKAIPFNNYTEYYVVVNGKEIVFGQEEYDLLKEVLL